jgi:hypothetical protein
VEHQRDTELENIVGNLLIAEYQVEKLKERLVGRIGSAYPSSINKKVSSHIFKSSDSWVKVSINVEKIAMDKAYGIRHGIKDEISRE